MEGEKRCKSPVVQRKSKKKTEKVKGETILCEFGSALCKWGKRRNTLGTVVDKFEKSFKINACFCVEKSVDNVNNSL